MFSFSNMLPFIIIHNNNRMIQMHAEEMRRQQERERQNRERRENESDKRNWFKLRKQKRRL